jgi:hypothetical protein
MIFSPPHYARIKLRLQKKYQQELSALTKSSKKSPKSPVNEWLLEHASELKTYSPIKWYLLKQIQAYRWFLSELPKLSHDPEVFTSHEEEVFERWNKSEFAGDFLKVLNKGKSVAAASEVALSHFEKHLITLGNRQILKLNDSNSSYRVQTSLGEKQIGKKMTRMLETTLHLEGKELSLMTHSMKEMKDFSQKIEVALKVIKKYSPDSWDRFGAFTEVIIPIKQSEFVSYSHQELPGFSMINLYDRDFVDLMDDLLHENGHHHLNYYLNISKLIDEPDDLIYYSPWRRTLRPLRGIYHASFTFFWAFKLFSALANAKEQDSIFYLFNASEKEKIYWRAVEEFYMLDYSYQDLQWAKRRGLIHEAGWGFIQEQRKELNKFKKKIPLWEKKLKEHRSELRDLKKALASARKTFKKLQ